MKLIVFSGRVNPPGILPEPSRPWQPTAVLVDMVGEETLNPAALETIRDWILDRFGTL